MTNAPHAALHRDAIELLAGWSAPDAGQSALREAFLGFLAARPDATRRSCEAGHLTASALVMSADRRSTLLTLHPRVGRWLQLGGHCEEQDLTMAGAALREATEESGIDGLRVLPDPIHLDVHPITCSLGVPNRHFDVQFAVIAPADAVAVISPESLDLRFFPIDALPADTDESLHDLIRSLPRGMAPAEGPKSPTEIRKVRRT
ncbi:NUDIX hydrolase [Nakamurella sp. PAMC28650]|jgi:8-oxo-dGTP pyrophosphatase MutT (NUDIX family)|uniref:NUDIX hydrolase n=1 Tax=Nakamurella sp. PAMC28650 TaxID=2762325 RepID=UPI00164DFBC8|nr:NUDIX hydrolase [Nakamurella sp. PAMC28650]QNK83185.1 NUDIX hydrolase [Nakamurella sp. PAMC28650]